MLLFAHGMSYPYEMLKLENYFITLWIVNPYTMNGNATSTFLVQLV